MKTNICLTLAAVLLTASGLFADAPTYRMSSITLGTVNRLASDSTMCDSTATVVPTTATLAFPGLTLARLWEDRYMLHGYFCGGPVAEEYRGRSLGTYCYQAYTNAAGVIEKALGEMIIVEKAASTYAKGMGIEYTDGPGGVYARLFSARYRQDGGTWDAFVRMDVGTGAYTYYNSEQALGTGWRTGGYGIAGLTASRCLRPDMDLPVWSNGAGEPVLTLDDIRDYDFHGFMAGGSLDIKGAAVEGYNKKLTLDDDGHVVRMVVEFQLLDDKYVKSVVAEFTNGAEGVVGRALAARYIALASGGALGYVFMTENGTLRGNESLVSLGWGNNVPGNYALFDVWASPPPPAVELVLDRSKTWSELVAGVDLGARDQVLNVSVTAENPVLTFDVPVDRARIAFSSGLENPGLTFRATGASFTVDRLDVKEGIALHTEPSLEAALTDLAAGATLVYDPQGAATLSGTVSGAGGIVILSGDVTMSSGDSSYMGGTRVASGATVRPGVRGTLKGTVKYGPFGTVSSGNPVWLEPGARYDANGMDGASCWIRGQGLDPIVNTGAPLSWNSEQAWGLVLDGDMELDMATDFGFVSSRHSYLGGLHLGNYTLRKRGPATLAFSGKPAEVKGTGTLEVCEGALQFSGVGDFWGGAAHLKVDAGAVVTNLSNMIFGSIENDGTIVLVPNDLTNRLEGAAYSGTGTVVVAAARTKIARATFISGPGRRYEVRSGRLMPCRNMRPAGNPYAFNTAEEPTLNQRVDVLPGATFDLCGFCDVNASATIAGTGWDGKGALQNTGGPIDEEHSQLVQLTLADDAMVGGTAQFGLLGPMHENVRAEFGTHTLTVDTAARFFLSTCTVGGNGAIDVRRGTLGFFRALAFDPGADLSVRVGAAGMLDNRVPLTLKDFENAGAVTNTAQTITVTGTATGGGADHPVPRLVLAPGSTVKVSDAAKPLAVSASLAASGTLGLDLAGIEMVGNAVPLILAPAGTVLADVTYEGRNLPPGTCISVRNGLPSLVKGGMVFYVR